MDYLPSAPVTLISEGRYDAFPVAATSGSRVVGAWRSAAARGHAADKAATIKAAISTDSGETYGKPFVAWDDADPLIECSPSGLAWDAAGGRFVMLVLRKTYPDAASTSPAYSAFLASSKDGASWAKLGKDLPTPAAAWWFASELVIDDGLWVVAGYGRLTGGVYGRPLTMVSRDAGATWSTVVEPTGMPSINSQEPQIVKTGSGWLMMARGDGNVFFQCRSGDGVSWSYDGAPLGGVSGCPEMAVTGDGTIVLLARDQPVIDNTHGTWLVANSRDGGMSWTLTSDFPGDGRYMMYGGLATTADGNLACVYASEADPSQPWVASNVYALRFLYTPLDAVLKVADGVPYVEVLGGGDRPIIRITRDPLTGDEVREPVRVRTLGSVGGAHDYELQQGRVAKYLVGDRETHEVVAPILSETMLINPARPAASIRARIVTDGERTYPLDSTSVDVPSATPAGLQYPTMTWSGRLGAAHGSTVIRTRREIEKHQLLDLFSDLYPVFWSHHPGLDMPEWIGLAGDIKEARFAQICACGCGHRIDDIGYWRDWTITWIAQPRPDVHALPFRRRIQDVNVPIQKVRLPIQEV